MRIEMKHKCKPNGANKFKYKEAYSQECTQWLVFDGECTNEAFLRHGISKCIVELQTKMRAECGDGEAEVSASDWAAVCANWEGREVTPEYLETPTSKGGMDKVQLAALEMLIGMRVSMGDSREEAMVWVEANAKTMIANRAKS